MSSEHLPGPVVIDLTGEDDYIPERFTQDVLVEACLDDATSDDSSEGAPSEYHPDYMPDSVVRELYLHRQQDHLCRTLT